MKKLMSLKNVIRAQISKMFTNAYIKYISKVQLCFASLCIQH